MNVANRKLFTNRDARAKLSSMGGIMASSPELLGEVQKFKTGTRNGEVVEANSMLSRILNPYLTPKQRNNFIGRAISGEYGLEVQKDTMNSALAGTFGENVRAKAESFKPILSAYGLGSESEDGLGSIDITEAFDNLEVDQAPELLQGVTPPIVEETPPVLSQPNIETQSFSSESMFNQQAPRPTVPEFPLARSAVAPSGMPLVEPPAPDPDRTRTLGDIVAENPRTPERDAMFNALKDRLSGFFGSEEPVTLEQLRAAQAKVATSEGIGSLPTSSALEQLKAAQNNVATSEGLGFNLNDLRIGDLGRSAADSVYSLFGGQDTSASDDGIMSQALAEIAARDPEAIARINAGTSISSRVTEPNQRQSLPSKVVETLRPYFSTEAEQLLADNSNQGGLLSSIKSFAGDVIGDLKEGGVKYFDERIAQQDASDVEEAADLSRLQANYQGILDKLAGGNLSDNQRTVLNRRKLALEEQYDANILATAIDPKNISRRITGALTKAGGNILAATGGNDETAVDVLDAADAMTASATTGKLDTLEAIRRAEAEAREQGEEIDPTLLAAVARKIETDTGTDTGTGTGTGTDTGTGTKLPPNNLIDIAKVTEELAGGRSGSDALVSGVTGTNQKLNPKEAVLAQQAIFKEMLGIKDEDKAKEKWHNMAMIGFAIAAGQDPNALSNVAGGLLEGTKMAREDRKANQKRDDEITMMSIQAVQDQKNRDDAYTQAMDVASVRSKGSPSTYTDERLRQSIIAKLPTTIDDYEDLGLVTDNKVDFKLVEKYIQNQMRLGSGTTPLTTDIPSGLPDPTTLSEGQTVTDRETGQVYTVVGGAWQ